MYVCYKLFIMIIIIFSAQTFSYIIVLDFESTCWKDKKGLQEISQ